MFKYFIYLLCASCMFYGLAEDEPTSPLTPEQILQYRDVLREAGRLDSVVIPITFFRNPSKKFEKARLFYIYQDTVFVKNRDIVAIGKRILDPQMDFHKDEIGEWIAYYTNDSMAYRGHFALGAFTFCGQKQKMNVGYAYKTGYWQYWYPNGVVLAEGLYKLAKSPNHPDKCGVDTSIESRPGLDWIVNDTSGNLVPVNDRYWRLSWLDFLFLNEQY